MAEIKPLDELLEHESLLFTGTNELLFRYGEQGYQDCKALKIKSIRILRKDSTMS
ncbi:hypothetical protein J4480_01260 [Candidatus Woesearchaeota archaeon]|nr:hypothetical protein [Candidatus Woesearchaeota archaeon]